MGTQRYEVNQYMISSVLAKVREGEIAIPEIQRPFVWDASQVRDLLDSLYKGYPVGYLIAWRNPDVKLKDGSVAQGRMILIDGPQRVTALTAAVLGQQVVNKDYRKVHICIAFHPIREEFKVADAAILKDPAWIPDVAPIISGEVGLLKAVRSYEKANPAIAEEPIEKALTALSDVAKKQVGLIELEHDLDIETVTEIFIRINSKGTVLSQADFVMSKIAADGKFGGPLLRKAIDYFCHLAVEPGFHDQVKEHDPDFASTDYFQKMSWLKGDNETLYDPSYIDVLRVTFGTEFGRGKLSDLVSLLSGRNFVTKQFEEVIAEETFQKMGCRPGPIHQRDALQALRNHHQVSRVHRERDGALTECLEFRVCVVPWPAAQGRRRARHREDGSPLVRLVDLDRAFLRRRRNSVRKGHPPGRGT